MKQMIATGVVYSMAVFYGCVTAFHIMYTWLRHVFRFLRVKERPLPPACLMDDSLGRHSYAKLKDVTLHYVENGDRNKPLMLCLHGFPEFWYSWRHQLREFSNAYWVVAIDMRGYGDSDKPAQKDAYKIPNLVGDVKDIISALGRTKADVLMAHDWGGAIAYSFTMKYPEMVERLVVMNCPHPQAFRKVLYSTSKQLKMSWYMFLFQLPYLPEFWIRLNDLNAFSNMYRDPQNENKTIISTEDIEAYKYMFSKPGALTPPINYYRNIDFGGDPLGPSTGRPMETPTLLVWGTGDIALCEETADATAEFVKDLKIKKLDGVTHWVNQDAPAQVNKIVLDFLQGLD